MNSEDDDAAVNMIVNLYPSGCQVEIEAQPRYDWGRGN